MEIEPTPFLSIMIMCPKLGYIGIPKHRCAWDVGFVESGVCLLSVICFCGEEHEVDLYEKTL